MRWILLLSILGCAADPRDTPLLSQDFFSAVKQLTPEERALVEGYEARGAVRAGLTIGGAIRLQQEHLLRWSKPGPICQEALATMREDCARPKPVIAHCQEYLSGLEAEKNWAKAEGSCRLIIDSIRAMEPEPKIDLAAPPAWPPTLK